ncbi:hypothetical protein BBC0122_001500 [Bartonella choladocola]|uniref:Uncharacterized protein n=1 Tax=Bartonella choladocola TaxID=2750995 RepID=A0A1U9MF02_9HYPH|nr:hypothetical protein BBC0122_001500 [Bartonella choladocola]
MEAFHVKTLRGNGFKLVITFKNLNKNLDQEKCVTKFRHAFYFFAKTLILKAVFNADVLHDWHALNPVLVHQCPKQ